jgi:hypothetical protein
MAFTFMKPASSTSS